MKNATKQEIIELMCAAKSPEAIAAKLNIDVDLVEDVIRELRADYRPDESDGERDHFDNLVNRFGMN